MQPRGPHCPHCWTERSDLSNPDNLNAHIAKECPLFFKCRYCDKVVEVRKMSEHILNQCDFVQGVMERCPKCSEPCSPEQLKKHNRGLNCRGEKPSYGADWCPLCDEEIFNANDQASWRTHIVKCPGKNTMFRS